MPAASIRRLSLTNFRSYHAAAIALDAAGPVVLVGPNGSGKTNLIEAISFLAPGRGLRRATLEEVAFSEGRLGDGLRRPSARDLAHSGDGPAVQRAGVRAAALP